MSVPPPSDPPGANVLVIGAPLGPGDVPGLCRRVRRLAARAGAEPIVCDVRALAPADVLTVHLLARLQLTARRLGTRIVLRDPAPGLNDLLRFSGLDAVLAPDRALLVEPDGQAEQREQPLRVQERVDRGDPAI